MGNRKQPFGYRMEHGEIAVHPQEADTVRCIFQNYLAGMGFAGLTEKLNAQDIRFYPGRPWNKNMVARILKDTRYAGAKDFPPIIGDDELATVELIRAERSTPCEVTPKQKMLRRLTGQRTGPRLEQAVLNVMNRLIANPMLISCPMMEKKDTSEAVTLKAQLDELLDNQPVDESKARPLIFRLASAQYQGIGNEEYETERLRDIFTRMAPISELDAGLLKETVAGIRENPNGTIQITLKNGQILERSETI